MAPPNVIEKPASRLLVAATVSFYIVAAIAMIMANKWVLNKTNTPLFFLLLQLLIAVILLLLSHILGFLRLPLQLDFGVCKKLVPMVAINVLGLTFNNFTLQNVDASFYQVARGLILPMTVFLSSLLLHTRPSLRILFSCLLVTSGFLVGVIMDNPSSRPISASWVGITFGLLSSLTTSLHAVVIKKSLAAVNGSALELAWYSNVLSACVLAPIVFLSGEVPDILDLFLGAVSPTDGDGLSALATFVWGSAITGVFGFLICVAGLLSIKITSPITHMISSAVRGVVQTFFAVTFFQDIITTGRASSIGIILLGSIYYTWEKNQETVRNEQAASSVALEKMEDGVGHPTASTTNGGYVPVPAEEKEAGTKD